MRGGFGYLSMRQTWPVSAKLFEIKLTRNWYIISLGSIHLYIRLIKKTHNENVDKINYSNINKEK